MIGVGMPIACSSSPSRDAATFCTAYVDVAASGAKLADPDELSLTALRNQVQRIDDAASDAAKVAPKDIADTVEAVIEPLHTLRKDLDAAKGRSDMDKALLGYRIDAGKLATTQQRLTSWTQQHCGVSPVTSTTVAATIQPGITG